MLGSSNLGSVDAPSCVEQNSMLINCSPNKLGSINAPSCVDKKFNPKEDLIESSKPIFNKNDIRAYGKSGIQTANGPKMTKNEYLPKQIESVRNGKPKVGVLPNMAERVLAGKLFDEMYGKKAIPVENVKKSPKT